VEEGSAVEALMNTRHSTPLQTADTVKWSFWIRRMAICWLISSRDVRSALNGKGTRGNILSSTTSTWHFRR